MLTFFFLSILFLTLIESILENVNDVVYLSFLSNESNTDIFYDNENDTIEVLLYFAVIEDKTIEDKKVIIISNINLHIIFSNFFVVGSHEY